MIVASMSTEKAEMLFMNKNGKIDLLKSFLKWLAASLCRSTKVCNFILKFTLLLKDCYVTDVLHI